MPLLKDLLDYSDDDLCKIVNEDFRASQDYRTLQMEAAWNANRMFHCRDIIDISTYQRPKTPGFFTGAGMALEELDGPLPNKAYLPFLRGVLLAGLAMDMNLLFPDFERFFRLIANHENDEAAIAANTAIIKRFIAESDFRREVMLARLSALKYPFGVLYSGWATRNKLIPDTIGFAETVWNFVTGKYDPTGRITEKRPTWKRAQEGYWDVTAVNFFNFHHDPMASHDGFESCEWAGTTSIMSKRRMKMLADVGFWDKKATKEIKDDEPISDNGGDDSTDDFNARLKRDEKLAGDVPDSGDYASYFVRVREYHTEDAVAYQLNGRVIARKQRTLGWPYHVTRFMPNEGMFAGTSMAESLMPIQHDINYALRLMRKQHERVMNPDLHVDGERFGSAEEALKQPWNTGSIVVATRNPRGLPPSSIAEQARVYTTAGNEVFAAINLQIDMASRVAGVSQSAQAGTTNTPRAAEIQQVAAGMNQRYLMLEKQTEKDLVLDPVIRLMQMIHMNVKDEVIIRTQGEGAANFQRIKPADLIFTSSPDVQVIGTSSMAGDIQIVQAARDTLLAMSVNPVFGPILMQNLKALPAARDILGRLGMDVEKWIGSPNAESLSQVEENTLMAQHGKHIEVKPTDNHAQHLQEGMKWMRSGASDGVDEDAKERITSHLEMHAQALQMSQGGMKSGLPGSLAAPKGAPGVAAQPGMAPAGMPSGSPSPPAPANPGGM